MHQTEHAGGARILATYRIAAPLDDRRARAEALAIEQSVEVPLAAVRTAFVRDEILARVEAITEADGGFDVVLSIAAETTGYEISQLINMVFGNGSMHRDVELTGLTCPAGYAAHFAGPRFGIDGLRERTGAHGRALTCTAIKPQGLTLDELSTLARTFVRAGIDVVKDDHGLTNQSYSRFAERVPVIQRVIDEANRAHGRRTCYAPTLSGSPSAILEQLRIARECGVGLFLVSPMLIGLPVFAELAGMAGVPLMTHPTFSGGARIAPDVLLGTLYRMCGADATTFANHGGRFGFSREVCHTLVDAARATSPHWKPSLPVAGGGMVTARVDDVLDEYGIDTMLLVGGGLLAAASVEDESRAFVERVRQYRSRT